VIAVETHNPALWIQLLIATIGATVVAVVADNAIKGEAKRPHNGPQLLNECLAEQHSAYLIFFFALAVGSGGFTNSWATFVLTMSALLWFAFYAQGVYSTTRHSAKITADHACTAGCTTGLKTRTNWSIFGMNLIFAVVLFVIACYLSCTAVKSPPQ
jgi:hypothetical protein